MASKKDIIDTSKGAIKKTIVRNVEVPIRRSHSQNKNKKPENKIAANFTSIPGKTSLLFFPEDYKEIHLPTPQTNSNNDESTKNVLHNPELQTNINLEIEIDKLKRLNLDLEENEKLELSPKTKALLDKKVTKSLNFPPDKPVFKDLIKLNVNDSIFLPSERIPIRKKYVSKGNQDPIPELADFLEPIPPLTLPKLPIYTRKPEVSKPVNDVWEQIYEIYRTTHPDE